jgi:CheY-like chemotaxis protein
MPCSPISTCPEWTAKNCCGGCPERSTAPIPVLVVSTDRTESRMQQMLTLGAKGYVTKPFTPETLREELEQCLGVAHGTD